MIACPIFRLFFRRKIVINLGNLSGNISASVFSHLFSCILFIKINERQIIRNKNVSIEHEFHAVLNPCLCQGKLYVYIRCEPFPLLHQF